MSFIRPGIPAVNIFTTNFLVTESPLSQSGTFTHGYQQVGTDALGPDVTGGTPGKCYSHAADANDYVATIQNRFTSNKHFSEVTINWASGYTAPSSQEIEVHVGTTIGPSSAVGYEFDLYFGGTVLQPIRWENPPGGFNTVWPTLVSGAWPGAVADGDVLRVEFDSTSGNPVFTIKLNGVTQIIYTDTSAGKILTGNPGFAFFVRTGAGVDVSKFCIKGYTAGSL